MKGWTKKLILKMNKHPEPVGKRLTNCKDYMILLFVYLRVFVPLENFSLIWRRHHCRLNAANLDLRSARVAIEQQRVVERATPTETRDIRL